ncbi:APC family permease [Risungbinella massiliensis]|uniref:APC family permease n=1 Tax=Risungbinella massiliensis TaxID=1329796 RepID=UPI0005CC896A|nr:amino acid permease [Risungbinella massiliensis]
MQMSENHLKKDIGFTVALSLVVGTVIGSGVFMKPGIILAQTGNSTDALWAWLIAGIITLAGGLTIAEIGAQIPKTGGLNVYLEETYGKVWGYLCGWMQTIIYGPAIIGTLGLYLGSLITNLFAIQEEWSIWMGIGFVLFLAGVNMFGTKYGGFVQTLSTVIKLIPIALIIIFGLWKGQSQIFDMGSGLTEEISMGAAVLAALFAYDGWILVGSVAGEMKNPTKLLPKAIIVGLTLVTVIYLLVNLALLHVLPAEQIVALGENAAGTAASVLFGDMGGKLISIGIIISIFGCLNGKIMAFPRIPFAMAERRQLPGSRYLMKVHPKFKTPIFAIVLQIVLAIILMLLSDPNRLSDIAVFSTFLFYILAFLAVFILRKRHSGTPRPYSVPLYPIIPLVAIIGSLFVIISSLMNEPMGSLMVVGITLAGWPLYQFMNRKSMVN